MIFFLYFYYIYYSNIYYISIPNISIPNISYIMGCIFHRWEVYRFTKVFSQPFRIPTGHKIKYFKRCKKCGKTKDCWKTVWSTQLY